ncbi:hypothetical protein COE58_03535 [Bacillus cereus]|nr:hypothetical protein COE58_03535 [Bacillus cereus]
MDQFGKAEEPYSWFIANGTLGFPGLGAKWIRSTGDMSVHGAFVPGGANYAWVFENSDLKSD